MSDATAAAKRQAAKAEYEKCPKCAAALAARKLMTGCDVCGGTGVVQVSHAPASDPRVEQYIRQENSRRGIW